MDRRIELPLQTRLAPIGSVDVKTRTADLVWSTGARVKRYDWMRDAAYMEELSLDSAHVRMGRLQNGAPLLNTHSRYSLGDVLGVVEHAALAGGQGTATVRFSAREEVEPIFRDVQDKVIRNVSVGYAVNKYERLPPDDASEGLPIYRAVDWEPHEISLVPVGADAGAAVRSDEQQRMFPCEIILHGERQMENEAIDPAVETAKPTRQELARTRAIRDLVQRQKELDGSLAVELIDSGATLAEARTRVLDELAKRTERTEIRSGHSGYDDIAAPESKVRYMAEALARRFGAAGELSEHAKPYAYTRASEMARLCLEMRGIRTSAMSPNQIIGRAMSDSSSDYATLLGDSVGRVLRQAYHAYQGGLKRIARQTTAPDFRTRRRIQVSGAPSLEKLLPGAEITQGSMSEMVETYALETYARIWGINRQALVNDDLGAFTQMAGKFGRAAAEREAQIFITLLSANSGLGPTMNDSKSLFHTDHGNTGSGAIDVTNVGIGIKAMRLQTDLDDETPIDATPKFLIVPAAKETLARQFVATITPAQTANVNPYSGQLEVVVDPRLDAVSATAWYLSADPNLIDTLEYAYLEGQEGVYTEQRMGWEVDGLEVKARLDIGCGALDWRGMFRSTGS